MTTSSSEVHCPICFEPFPFSHFDAHAATHKVLSSNIFEKTRKLLGKSNFTQNELNLNENLIISGLDDRDYDAFMNLTVEEREEDMTAWITKRHFVESTVCIECRLALGLVNGNNNCAKCGKGYCTNHCRYQMKLSIDARWDSV